MVTTAAGGADDFVARTVSQRLSATMGRPIIIENEPAGNGSVAAGEVARAPADGYTLMMVVDSTLTINPHLYKTINYDVFRDFTPISIISRLPTCCWLARSAGQQRPGVDCARSCSPGQAELRLDWRWYRAACRHGNVQDHNQDRYRSRALRSTPGAQNDLMAGRIDVMLAGIGAALSHNESSRSWPSPRRCVRRCYRTYQLSPSSGVPGFDLTSWFALLGPPHLPQPVMDRLTAELKKAAGDPQFRSMFEKVGMQVVVSSPPEMRAEMEANSKKWSDVIKVIGLTINQ